MAFYAKNFTFDDIPSEFYNLYLGEYNGSGEAITAASSDVSLLTQKLFRKPVPLFWGAESTPVLSFPVSVYCPGELTADEFSNVSAWLFGQMNYKELRICQNDMQEVYFNCFLTSPQIVREGNLIRGMTFTVVCDAPWGWKQSKTYTYGTYGGYTINETVYLLNESANNGYTYPSSLIVTGNIFGGTATITNVSDASRQFIYTLSPSEVVTIDCENQIMTSTLVTYPIASFNLNFLRLIRGYNQLQFTGNITSVSITSPVAVKIGG
jgi:phage-related protein